MRVFVINGSPKGEKSNTYRLTAAFLEGMNRAQAQEVREITVSRMEIKPCIGCFSCWNRTPGQCCIRDDMAGVLENMLWADVILWSFPLYYFGVPGGLKNMMDRQLPLVLPFMESGAESGGHPTRFDMSGKRHIVISTCGFYTAEGNYTGVNAMFDHLCGKGNYTTLYCGQGELFRVKELSARTGEYLGYVADAGEEYCSAGITSATREKLGQLLYPRKVFEAMADASWGVDQSGHQADETLTFTRQMAALYHPKAYSGREIVLEMDYTDVNKRYQIILGAGGSTVLTDDFREPTTTIQTPYTVWKAIAAGEISGEEAMMQGKYRVQGDFNLMIQWDRYFGGEGEQKPAAKPDLRRTSMLNLMSWAALWMLAGLHPLYGPLGAIAVCALLPVVLYRTKRTVYDRISALAVTLCACAVLAGMVMEDMLLVSFFCFGLMWTVSCFCKVPLSAHYVVNQYGDAMAENPLFLKTNRIICAGWGILYLLIPLVALLSRHTVFAPIGEAVLPVGSAAMGIFTLWFQKWYPAKVARGK